MLESENKSFFSKIDMKKTAIISVISIVVILIAWRFVTLAMPDNGELGEQGPSAGAASTIVKDTGFNGKQENVDDPAAIRAYCDDLSLAAKSGGGGKIRDLCILDEVVKTYLPSLTDEEIANLAETDPTCLETGYGKDGFNCFTNFDKNGCDRSGFDENGNKCENARKPLHDEGERLVSVVPDNICDLVSGCQSEAEFGPDGFNRFGCNRQGKDKNGVMCPAEYITRIYDDKGRDQLGFTKEGFNIHGCDAQGFKETGEACPLSQVTRLFDKNAFDQFGFDDKNYNKFGCGINGLNESGEVCPLDKITRKVDPITKLDQFGLGEDGFNEKGCNLEGISRTGELCSLEDTPRIWGKDGLDQFGLRKNNRNKFNCSLDGFKPDGQICKEEELTLRFSPKSGKDQFGRYRNGRNDFDCDIRGFKPDGSLCSRVEMSSRVNPVTGVDQNGLDEDGFNEKNCNVYGFDRQNRRCKFEDIPRLVNEKTGLDQFGIGEDGFNSKGCSLSGFDRNGELCDLKDMPRIYNPITGLDQFGFADDNYNENGCDINGLTRTGELCAIEDITKIFNPKTGLDQFSLDKDMFDPNTGCNLSGFNRNGVRCDYDDIPKIKDKNGVNQLGFGEDGRNSFGCDINGLKEDGAQCSSSEMSSSYDEDNMNAFHRDPDNFSRLGFNDLNFNKNNCDIDGRRPDGTLCPIDEITSIYDSETKLDQFGLDEDGFNEYSCNLKGFDRNGNKCPEELIPRIFGKDMKDQFGNHISELPESVWLKQKEDSASLSPLLDENGNQVYLDGEPVYTDKYGVLRNKDNVALKDKFGSTMKLGFDGKVTDSQGNEVALSDSDGEVVSGLFSSDATSLSPLLDQNGDPVMVNGKVAMVDKMGRVRDQDGNLITGSNGESIQLQEDGTLKDSSGNVVESYTSSGKKVKGPLHTDSQGLTPVLDANGEQVFIDGEAVYRDENGVLRKANNEIFRDQNNGLLSLSDDGRIKDSFGNAIELTKANGDVVDTPVHSGGLGLEPLLDANGEPVTIDGKQAFVDKNGLVRSADGELLRGRDGEPLKLLDNGLVVDGDGNAVAVAKRGSSKVSSVSKEGVNRSPLLDKNGRQVYIDGKPVWSDEDGNVYDENNNPVLGKDGTQLKLDDAGNLVDSSGNVTTAETQTGARVDGPLSAKSAGLAPLLNSDGERLMINGKPAFTDKNGVVRDENGNVILDSNGEPMILADGVVTDSKGQIVDTQMLDGSKNTKGVQSRNVEDASNLSPLLDENGRQVFVDGKPLFVDESGQVKFKNGEIAKDKSGKPFELVDGVLRDSTGKKVDTFDYKGERTKGKLVSADLNEDMKPLLDENGRQVFVDGKPLFVDSKGRVKFENGEIAKDKAGNPLSLVDGEVVNSKGNKIATFTSTGEKSVGALKSGKGLSTIEPLLDENGKQVFIDGKPVFVNKDGVVTDEFGNSMKDEFGQALKLKNGEVVDSNGGKVTLTDEDGNLAEGKVAPAEKPAPMKPLLDENGEQVFIDGKPVYVDENGNVKDAFGQTMEDEFGNELKFKNGSVVKSNGEKVTLRTVDGDVVKGKVKPAPSRPSLEKLLDANGDPVYIDGKPVFVDEEGNIKDALGNEILTSSGETMRFNGDSIVDSKGAKVLPLDVNGNVVSSKLSKSGSQNKPLLDKDGNQVYVNGKKAFVGKDGLLRDENNNLITDENGEFVSLNSNGSLVNSSGAKVEASDSVGNRVEGPLRSGERGLAPLLSESGEELFFDSKRAFIGDDGLLRDESGELILDAKGQPLRALANGDIVDSEGNKVSLTDSLGRKVAGKVYSAIDETEELLTSEGSAVFVNGERATVDSLGRIRNSDGEFIRDEFGGIMTLSESGEVLNSKGDAVSVYDENGKVNTGPLHTETKGVSALLSEDGQRVKVNGVEAFVRKDGVVVDENGEPIVDENGGFYRVSNDGVVRDSLGQVAEVESLSGELVEGPLHTATKGLSPLVDANGEQVYVDGKPVFVDNEGNVKDQNGNLFRTRSGDLLEVDENGVLVDENGNKVIARDRSGNLISTPLSAGEKGLKPLLDANGEQVLINGEPAFVDSDGNVKSFDGKDIRENGRALRLNEKGEVVDSSGRVIQATEPSDKVSTALFAKDLDKEQLRPLLNSEGELMYIGDKAAFLDENGMLVDENGRAFRDSKGSRLSLNGNGQVVNELGEVQPSSLIRNSKGEESLMPLVVGRPMSKTELSAKKAAEKLTASQRAALGLGEDGYNDLGCSLEGLDRNGKLCPIDNVPRLFDKNTGLDQFGLGKDNFNIYGCSLEGLDRNGEKCREEYVTRIYGEDGYDHRSINKAGLNRAGLAPGAIDIMGCDAAGNNCSENKSPQLTDAAGVNQFGKKSDGRDRLNLINGRNEFGCDLNGLDAAGERCEFNKIPRFYNSDNFDQFGINEQGYNKFNCNVEGRKPDGTRCSLNETPRIFDSNQRDQFGLSLEGRNEFGCDLLGYKEDGSRCPVEQITRLVDENGIDQLGLNSENLNSKGCGLDGRRKDGSLCSLEDTPRIFNPITGRDQFGLDEDGFNEKSCNLKGLDREGKLCKPDDIPRIYDANGVDQLGFGKDGRNSDGCDFYGYKEDGSLCSADELTRIFDDESNDQYGANKKSGRNQNGCDLNGLMPNGKRCKTQRMIRFVNKDGVDQFGFTESGKNENGCDINGLDENGERCRIGEITNIIDPETGLNQLGFKEDGTNEFGCSVSGLKKDGTPCDVDKLTSWFDAEGKDQFNLDSSGFNDSECNLLGYRKDGTRCDYENIPKIVGKHGFDQFEIGPDGYNAKGEDYRGFDRNGCDAMNRKEDGTLCSKYRNLGLTVEDGQYMATKKAQMEAWATKMRAAKESAFKASTSGSTATYKAEADPLFAKPSQSNSVAVVDRKINSQSDVTNSFVSGNIAGGNGENQNNKVFEKIQIPMGYMAGIYVNQPVNSDYTQDVYAEITTGELAGSKLKGRVVVPYVEDPVMPRDMFYYEFDNLVYKRQTIPISAISIELSNDSGMVEADDVNYHRIQRYGGLIVASAIQALDATFLDSQTEKDAQAQADAIGDAANTAVVYGENTRNLTKQNMQVATEYVSDLAKQQFFRRPTIKNGAGPQMIIFREEVQDERLPMVVVGLD